MAEITIQPNITINVEIIIDGDVNEASVNELYEKLKSIFDSSDFDIDDNSLTIKSSKNDKVISKT